MLVVDRQTIPQEELQRARTLPAPADGVAVEHLRLRIRANETPADVADLLRIVAWLRPVTLVTLLTDNAELPDKLWDTLIGCKTTRLSWEVRMPPPPDACYAGYGAGLDRLLSAGLEDLALPRLYTASLFPSVCGLRARASSSSSLRRLSLTADLGDRTLWGMMAQKAVSYPGTVRLAVDGVDCTPPRTLVWRNLSSPTRCLELSGSAILSALRLLHDPVREDRSVSKLRLELGRVGDQDEWLEQIRESPPPWSHVLAWARDRVELHLRLCAPFDEGEYYVLGLIHGPWSELSEAILAAASPNSSGPRMVAVVVTLEADDPEGCQQWVDELRYLAKELADPQAANRFHLTLSCPTQVYGENIDLSDFPEHPNVVVFRRRT